MFWFREILPIKAKMRVAFGLQFALIALASMIALTSHGSLPSATLYLIYGSILGLSGISALLMSRAITFPYVTTVVRMEALAVGDLDTKIQFTDYKDCVGRMTQAMHKFRDAAIARIAAENAAEQQRQLSREERAKADAERAESARCQAEVVDGIASGLSKLASGDLMQRLDQPFAAAYEGLRTDFNAAVAQMQETMKEVLSNTGAIRSGTEEISAASDDLSRRTEQQAASLEETAAALDEITATVKKTAEGAGHAREVVGVARKDAEHSSEVVGRAVKAMDGINASSRQIGQIIGVIDEIAFQTNLLALNAGVEAARAGDAGRGFAVVASEVRALAQRSAEAAKEIKALVLASDSQVKAGVELVGETGKALVRIAEQVTEINTVVAEIAASAQEQAAGLAQVNTTVNQMDQVTQQNAAMVEESTAAAHNLSQETDELARLVGRFQVGEGVLPQTSRSKPRPARHAAKPVYKTAGSRRGTVIPLRDGSAAAQNWEEF